MSEWNVIEKLPPMLSGEALKREMTILPPYDEGIRQEGVSQRLMALNNIYGVYLPSIMSQEIYCKIYLAMLRSLQKKGSKLVNMQRNHNAKMAMGKECGFVGMIGGSDSFTIIGDSGIGKSSAISRAIHIATQNRILEMENPYCKIIPSIMVQCPFDCSVKGLLLQILKEVDMELDTHYYDMAIKTHATIDMLIGNVSQVSLNHIGLLIVDEIQNVVNHRQGKSLVGCLTQLINNSGISICMVGVKEAKEFFENIDYLARRALGLEYDKLAYDTYFKSLCDTLFSYQYVKEESELMDGLYSWLYEHSGGVVANLIALIHDAQEISILNGREKLDYVALSEAYDKRIGMLHIHINPEIKIKNASKRKKVDKVDMSVGSSPSKEKRQDIGIEGNQVRKECDTYTEDSFSFENLAQRAKKENVSILSLLEGKISVTEIAI